MANTLGINGAQPQKPTRYSPVYTGRLFSGLWTNRSPLRDAGSTRLEEKFYGARGDALIDGLNIEVTNRLTLARRPGNPAFDNNQYSNVDRFYEFRKFSTTAEQINVMVDQANALYALYNGTKTLVWTKSTGAASSYMQSVGNSLYFGNTIDQKKWLQSLSVWTAAGQWGTPTTPFQSTFLIDANGNIQQLTSTVIPINQVQIISNILSVQSPNVLDNILSIGLQITFPPSGMVASFLQGQTITILSVAGHVFTAGFTHADYSFTPEPSIPIMTVVQGGTPISGAFIPTWNTVVPASGNNFAGGTTIDNTVLWTNRGPTIENWGIDVSKFTAVQPSVLGSAGGWQAGTYYSPDGLIIDSNGGLQQVTTAGKSGGSLPSWQAAGAGVGTTTNDGTIVWTKRQTAASLVWASHFAYNPDASPAQYVVSQASNGAQCLFKLKRGLSNAGVTLTGTTRVNFYDNSTGIEQNGTFQASGALPAPTSGPTTVSSLQFNPTAGASPSNILNNAVINGNGEIANYTTPWGGADTHFAMVCWGSFDVKQAGVMAMGVGHNDGFYFGVDNGAKLQSGSKVGLPGSNLTALQNYPVLGGNNINGANFELYLISFPAAGTYHFEFDYVNGSGSDKTLGIQAFYQICINPLVSSTNAPKWPAWSTTLAPAKPQVFDASLDVATNFVPVSSSNLVWVNQGPISDMVWTPNTSFHLAGGIQDSNANQENVFRSGISGGVTPTWKTGLNQLTIDNVNSNLTWINAGQVSAPPGTLSAFNGGFKYTIALVNTLDNTVSNGVPLSTATGNFVGVTGVTIPPASGLPANLALIDPQADYVAIFRTTDGLTTPFLIPGTGNSIYTVPLTTYITNGYLDKTQDVGLNNLIQAAMAGENTPPAAGAINLIYHLNRIFFSIGNTVYWTAGPDTPVGNGVNGVPPLNFDGLPSLVTRLVPIGTGMLVFTVSDIFVIPGDGTTAYPIQRAKPFLTGIGLLHYDALDINGSVIGMFTSDNQFLILDPTSGTSVAGFPIGDRFRQNNGGIGTSWNPANVYVTWHVSGEDQAWYVGDGANGWYRLNPTPAPEAGYAWSPFAKISGGVLALKSVEITPGVHRLLLGPPATGNVLYRDVTTFQDNGNNYPATGTIGSIVLAQPGQVAEVAFITTESVKYGQPLTIAIVVDEALPYYTGPFEILNNWVEDIPNQPLSSSIYAQRFYFSDLQTETAICRHLQIQFTWQQEPVANELLTTTIFGGFLQEK